MPEFEMTPHSLERLHKNIYNLILLLFIILLPIETMVNGFHRYIPRRKINIGLELNMRSSDIINSVVCGDSRNIDTYKLLFSIDNIKAADILLTDPPYCLLERRRKGGDLRDPKSYKKKIDNDPTVTRFTDVKAFTYFTKQWLDIAIKYVKPTAPLIIWTNALGKAPTIKLCQERNYIFLNEYLWAKRTSLTTEKEAIQSTKNEVLLRIYETALVFLPKDSPYHKQLTNDDKYIPWSCVTGYHDEKENKEEIQVHRHPCHKPYASLDPLLRTWTQPGDVILDCFAGSGGIPEACIKLGRHIRGVEILPEWAKHTQSLIKLYDDKII